ncbi:MAG TPA: glycoside hydrolase family 15 protein [Rhizomicrobium sp.]|jgi:GH15 family glucan-1,4-alpha-glucosidase|nr:glycoside hydrolase family 15 protein [Rhizomicrobium sp.]
MALRIEDYAIIGDGHSAALVGRDGSIDWLCWPRFDSEACFAALLGGVEQGRWKIAPMQSSTSTRQYRGDSLILETNFVTADGEATVVDFMPPRGTARAIIRLVTGKSGRVPMQMEFVPRFGYGHHDPWINRLEDGSLRAISGPDLITLRTSVALKLEGARALGHFEVAPGDTVYFILRYSPSHLPLPSQRTNPRTALVETESFWKQWIGQYTDRGEWSGAVRRSLITLKALIYAPTGGIVAAPTTSLPECLGGTRNWDYRFCWLRDATLTLMALMNAGYFDEASQWREWLLRAASGRPSELQIMYGLAGERRLEEWEADWLPGYENSRPVRIGNAAYSQAQLDVFGEVMDALHQARRGGMPSGEADWGLQRLLIDHVAKIWQQPDQGIWEVRSGPEHFTYSKVMAWVAVDRAIHGAEGFGFHAPVEEWRALRRRIHEDVCRNGFDARIGSFVRAYGTTHLDASLLLLAEVGFLPPDDPRIVGTVEAVERELLVDGFLLRYNTEVAHDGLPAGEGAFLACSFWLADAYVLMGRQQDARELFTRLLSLRNDVGLLAEQYDVRAKRQVGNFPQAFSHVALVNTAHNLTRRAKPVEQRSAHPSQKSPR